MDRDFREALVVMLSKLETMGVALETDDEARIYERYCDVNDVLRLIDKTECRLRSLSQQLERELAMTYKMNDPVPIKWRKK